MQVVEGRNAAEPRVDSPDFVPDPRDFMDPDVAAGMAAHGQERGITVTDRVQLGCNLAVVAELPDLGTGSHGQPLAAGIVSEAHRAGKVAEVGIQRVAVGADKDQLPGLISRYSE